MSTTTLFNCVGNVHMSYEINTHFRIHFESIDLFVTHMYFTNGDGEYVDVPKTLVTVYTVEPNGVELKIHNVTDPLIAHMQNKSRMGYLHSYYVLDENQKYDIHVFSKLALRLEPQRGWKLINHSFTDYVKH